MSTIQLIGLSKEDLKDLFGDVLKSEIRTFKKQMEPKQENHYLTRKEVSQMLKIDLSSVHNWSKKGILKPHQIGSRVYYKLSEIENSIIQLKTGKNEQ
jgi:predicted DNA-binding transcriptional regulator AlpA